MLSSSADDAFIGEYTELFVIQLTKQIDSLLENAFELQNFHNESKVVLCAGDDSDDEASEEEVPEQSSLGSITSGDEDDCATLFKGEHKYRFQAEETIKQTARENERRQAHQTQAQSQPSRCRRLMNCLTCRRPPTPPGSQSNLNGSGRENLSASKRQMRPPTSGRHLLDKSKDGKPLSVEKDVKIG